MKHFWRHVCVLGILMTNNIVFTKSFHSQNFGIYFGDDGITYEYDEDSGNKDSTLLFDTHDLDEFVTVNGSQGTGELSLCPNGEKPYIGRLRFSALKLNKPPNVIQFKIDLTSRECLYPKLQSGINVYLNIRALTLGSEDVLTLSSNQNTQNLPRSKSFTSSMDALVLDDGTRSFGQMLMTELPFYISLNHTSSLTDLSSDAGFSIDYSFVSPTPKAGYTCPCQLLGGYVHSESLKELGIISCPETWLPLSNGSDPSGPHKFQCENLSAPNPCCPLFPTPHLTTPSPIKWTTVFIRPPRPNNPFNQNSDFQSVSIILGVTAGVLLVAVVVFAVMTYRVRMEQTRQATAVLAAREQQHIHGQANGGMVVDEEPPPVYGAPPTYAEAMQGENVVVLRGFGEDEDDGYCENQPPVEIVGNDNNTLSYGPESGSTEPIRDGGTVNVGVQPDEAITGGLPEDKAGSSLSH